MADAALLMDGGKLPVRRLDAAEVAAAIDQLSARAIARAEANELARLMQSARASDLQDYRARQGGLMLALVRKLYEAGRVTSEQQVLMAAFEAERIVDENVSAGRYSDLSALSRKSREIEREYGLAQDQYWPIQAGPPEWRLLQEAWSEAHHAHCAQALDDIGFADLASVYRRDRDTFDAWREAGRRSIFHNGDLRNAVADLVTSYEDQAVRCKGAGAAYGAAGLYGAACEARLLLTVMDRSDEAEAARCRLSRAERPRPDPSGWHLGHLVKVAAEAGWLHEHEHEAGTLFTGGWLHELQQVRNLLHAGRHASEEPFARLGSESAQDAKAIYTLLCASLQRLPDPSPNR